MVVLKKARGLETNTCEINRAEKSSEKPSCEAEVDNEDSPFLTFLNGISLEKFPHSFFTQGSDGFKGHFCND